MPEEFCGVMKPGFPLKIHMALDNSGRHLHYSRKQWQEEEEEKTPMTSIKSPLITKLQPTACQYK